MKPGYAASFQSPGHTHCPECYCLFPGPFQGQMWATSVEKGEMDLLDQLQ